MGRIRQVDPSKYGHASQRAAVLVGVNETYLNRSAFDLESILDIVRGAAPEADGRWVSNLMGAPSIAESDERQNPYEGLYGRTGRYKGEEQVISTDKTVTLTPTSMDYDTYRLMRPDAIFEDVLAVDGTTKIGFSVKRRGFIDLTDYVKNVVVLHSSGTRVVHKVTILREAININEDKEEEFDDDGQVHGVELQMACHSDGSQVDPTTGLDLPNFQEIKLGSFIPAAPVTP